MVWLLHAYSERVTYWFPESPYRGLRTHAMPSVSNHNMGVTDWSMGGFRFSRKL